MISKGTMMVGVEPTASEARNPPAEDVAEIPRSVLGRLPGQQLPAGMSSGRPTGPACLGRRAVLAGSLGLASVSAAAATAPQVTQLPGGPPRAILFAGNSFFRFNRGIHEQVAALAAGLAPPVALRARAFTRSGAGLRDHDIAAYLSEADADQAGGAFDTLVMADCAVCTFGRETRDLFLPLVRQHSETARRRGARPVLFMTAAWPHRPEMLAPVVEAYTSAGNANAVLVIPAGLAFARAKAIRPELALHIQDNRHPTLAGSYLAAATTFAALFGRSPAGSSYTAGLSPDTARMLRDVAWDTTVLYFSGRPAG